MTLNQANSLIEQHSNLIGKFHKDSIISKIVAVPKAELALSQIVNHIIIGKDYAHIQAGHYEFDVIAFLDLDDYSMSGILKFEYLQNITNYRDER